MNRQVPGETNRFVNAYLLLSLSAMQSFNEHLIRQIVPLLNSGDELLMNASLAMVEQLGGRAIALGRDELAILANDSSHQQMADRARKLLENSR